MDTPRPRFSVMPFLLAFTVGLMSLPSTLIVKVNARGLGHVRELPWLNRSVDTGRAVLARMATHRMFRPALTLAAVLIGSWLFDPAVLLAAPFAVGVTLTEGQNTAEALVWEANSLFRKSITVLSGQNLKAGAVVGRVKLGIGRVSIPAVAGTGNGTASLVFAGPDVEVGNYVVKCTAVATHGGTFSVTTPSGKLLPALTLTPGSGGATAYTSSHINFTITDGGTDFALNDTFTFVVSTTAPTVIGGTGTGVMTALSLGPDAKPGRYQVINRVVVANGGDFEVIGPDGVSLGRFIWTNSGSTASFTSRQINFTLSDATDYIAANYFDICVFNQLAGGKVVAWDPTTFDGRHRVAGVLYAAVDATSADGKGVIVDSPAVVDKGALQWGAAITAAQKESAYLEMAAKNITALDAAAA